jgi:hypothetical protein
MRIVTKPRIMHIMRISGSPLRAVSQPSQLGSVPPIKAIVFGIPLPKSHQINGAIGKPQPPNK